MMKKYIKWTIIVVLCVLVLLIKNEFTPLLLKEATYGMPALIDRKHVKNLYLGSSMFRQGIDIVTLEEKSVGNNYILAYNGNQPALEYYQLLNLVEQGVTIDYLYIDMYVYSAWEEPKIADEKLFLETNIKEKYLLFKLINEDKIDLATLWRMFITSNNELLLSWPLNNILVNQQFLSGGSLSKTECANKVELDSEVAFGINQKMNPTQMEYLLKIISLAKEKNWNLLFVETPKYQVINQDKGYLQAMKEYTNFLETNEVNYLVSFYTADYLQNSSPYMRAYEFDISNHEYYMDKVHLSYDGRIAFTQVLTETVINYL